MSTFVSRLIALFSALLCACTSVSSTDNFSHDPFTLTAQQADQVVLESIQEGWPDKKTTPSEDDAIGYRFKVFWDSDLDLVDARAVPSGENQYEFQVGVTGTAPAAGNPARKQLLGLIVKKAEERSAVSS